MRSLLLLALFGATHACDMPILYFGYQHDFMSQNRQKIASLSHTYTKQPDQVVRNHPFWSATSNGKDVILYWGGDCGWLVNPRGNSLQDTYPCAHAGDAIHRIGTDFQTQGIEIADDADLTVTSYPRGADTRYFAARCNVHTCPDVTIAWTGVEECNCNWVQCQPFEYCDTSNGGMCHPTPPCVTSGSNPAACRCGQETCSALEYCDGTTCSASPDCTVTDGSTHTSTPCTCDSVYCGNGEFCDNGVCHATPRCNVTDASAANPPCRCGTADCVDGEFCDALTNTCGTWAKGAATGALDQVCPSWCYNNHYRSLKDSEQLADCLRAADNDPMAVHDYNPTCRL